MRRVPIRLKLAAALAVPLVALCIMTSLEVRALGGEVDEVTAQAALARAAVGPNGLINHLQDERTWAAVELVGSNSLGVTAPVESYEETRQATDEAVRELREQIRGAGPVAAAAFGPALENLADLDPLRAEIDDNRATSPVVGTSDNNAFAEGMYDRYIAMIRPLFDATDQVSLTIADDRLRRGAQLVNTTSRNIELFVDMARRHLIVGSQGGGIDERSEIQEAARAKSLWDHNNRLITSAEAPYDTVVAEHFPAEFVGSFTAMVERAIAGEVVPTDELIAPLTTDDWGGLRELRSEAAEAVNETADDIVGRARMRERLFLALVVLALTAALGLTWLVSRSITRPLQSLTAQAKHMAGDRLPRAVTEVLATPLGEDVTVPLVEPVRVATRDEVVDVAQALNSVQSRALELAVEQAVLRRNIADSFVNLGRRNQNLLARQLDFITSLERIETDPDVLANLFRLDHLATRMRRNAESLLVLAGVEPPRQWARPVPLTDVVRSALGEVEDYQRVAVRSVEQVTVIGSAAADLAHLLAELVENALVASPDDQVVDVRSRDEADGSHVIAVIDAGVGMAAESLEAANRRLAGDESFAVAPSRYLGHYVAANLAARHDIGVRLAPGVSGGVTATVHLPPDLLVRDAAPAAGLPPADSGPPPRAPRELVG
ncbi:MAG TPA: nitrate- and nitrite sensing domain-containing protein [Acidimicrobiales bacterium]|nr:nitrate- and nitrite sensing domain-containing protein [Acidimicrobiales bacterium]